MIELERTFLAKSLPKGLEQCKKFEMHDIYVPNETGHATLRIRKKGKKFEITRKEPQENDPSEMIETTIPITEKEFDVLKKINGYATRKNRYECPVGNRIAEIDVFLDDLSGLVLIDFEFENTEEKKRFTKPEICLSDVTNEAFIAGGMLCGKKYSDIAEKLANFGYKKIEQGAL